MPNQIEKALFGALTVEDSVRLAILMANRWAMMGGAPQSCINAIADSGLTESEQESATRFEQDYAILSRTKHDSAARILEYVLALRWGKGPYEGGRWHNNYDPLSRIRGEAYNIEMSRQGLEKPPETEAAWASRARAVAEDVDRKIGFMIANL